MTIIQTTRGSKVNHIPYCLPHRKRYHLISRTVRRWLWVDKRLPIQAADRTSFSFLTGVRSERSDRTLREGNGQIEDFNTVKSMRNDYVELKNDDVEEGNG